MRRDGNWAWNDLPRRNQASAKKSLAKVPQFARRRIDAVILSLGEDPRPVGVIKLTGQRSTYRARVGDYRIVYEVDDAVRIVEVQAIDHRRDVYRDL